MDDGHALSPGSPQQLGEPAQRLGRGGHAVVRPGVVVVVQDLVHVPRGIVRQQQLARGDVVVQLCLPHVAQCEVAVPEALAD